MLNTWWAIIVDKFLCKRNRLEHDLSWTSLYLNLWFFRARSWFIDWHLDCFLFIRYDNGTKRWILCVNHTVINGPETMELKRIFVPRITLTIFSERKIFKKLIYHLVVFSISLSGMLPTIWSIKSNLTSGLKQINEILLPLILANNLTILPIKHLCFSMDADDSLVRINQHNLHVPPMCVLYHHTARRKMKHYLIPSSLNGNFILLFECKPFSPNHVHRFLSRYP